MNPTQCNSRRVSPRLLPIAGDKTKGCNIANKQTGTTPRAPNPNPNPNPSFFPPTSEIRGVVLRLGASLCGSPYPLPAPLPCLLLSFFFCRLYLSCVFFCLFVSSSSRKMPAFAVVAEEEHEENDATDLLHQSCFVLHGGGTAPKEEEEVQQTSLPMILEDELQCCGVWRMQAFNIVWGRLETLAQATLEEQNEESYKEIVRWVCNRQFCDAQQQLYRSAGFTAIHAIQQQESGSIFKKGPHMVGSFNKQLHTGFLFLGGVDLSDHENTFKGLATYLREHKCHVARLLPCDFPVRCHIGVPLSSLLRQFVQVNVETTDMEILAAWYAEPSNSGHPVVITIENVERCNSAILAELIVLLSEWSAEIPIVLVMGVATTADFLQGCLPSHALARLNAQRFDLKTPLERLEAVVKAVLVESFSAFEIGHGVAQFITHFFLRHDLTISSFIRSLKVVCMEHFCNEPLSFLSEQLLKCRSQVELENQCATLPTELLQLAEGLPSVKRHFSRSGAEEEDGNVCISKHVAARLWALREQKQLWSMALLCVYEVGRHAGLRFLDLFCEALHTTLSSSSEIEKVPAESFLSSNLPQRMTSCGSSRGWQELKLKIREMSVPILRSLLEEWKKITSNATKLHSEISAVYNKIIMGEEKVEHPTQSHVATSRVGATQALPTVVLQTPDQPEYGSHLGQQVTNGSLTKEFPASSSPGNKRYKKSGQVSHDISNMGGSSPASNLRRRPLHEESPQFHAIDLPKSPERRAPPVVCSVQETTVGCTSIVLPSSPERTFQVPGLQESPRCPAAASRSMKSLKKAASPPSKSPRKSPRRQTTTLLKSSTDKISSSSPSDLRKPNTRQTTTPLKSSLPEKASPDLGLQGSPRRMSTRLLSKSPEKASAVPGMQFSPTQHIKSKSPKSLEKVPLVLTLQKSPRKTSGKLIQSPWKLKSPIATCSPSQQRSSAAPDKVPAATQQAPHQAMGRSDLRKMASQNSLGNTRPGIMMMAPNQMVLDLLDDIVGQYLVPCQALPLHEIICFKDVNLLKQAITADTRQKVELDMLGSQLNLQCECCSPDGGLSGSMHDTCLVYHLSQEHGELINVHDWYQSFTAICCPPKASSDKQMSKRKDRRKGKRGRVEAESPSVLVDSTTLQARFTRATMELQLVGLLRMPKKGCPDFAQRVVLG